MVGEAGECGKVVRYSWSKLEGTETAKQYHWLTSADWMMDHCTDHHSSLRWRDTAFQHVGMRMTDVLSMSTSESQKQSPTMISYESMIGQY